MDEIAQLRAALQKVDRLAGENAMLTADTLKEVHGVIEGHAKLIGGLMDHIERLHERVAALERA